MRTEQNTQFKRIVSEVLYGEGKSNLRKGKNVLKSALEKANTENILDGLQRYWYK